MYLTGPSYSLEISMYEIFSTHLQQMNVKDEGNESCYLDCNEAILEIQQDHLKYWPQLKPP